MIFLRPIELADLKGLVRLNSLSGVGMTNFPKDLALLEQKILNSTESFEKEVTQAGEEHYLFALVDSHTHELLGISAIFATTGKGEPTYFFKQEKIHQDSPLEEVVQDIPILSPISYARGPTEICSLFLDPRFRKSGLGRLLSCARFHFIAAFPKRFTNSIFTELRGVIENDTSPFWDGVGKHFFNCSFLEALEHLKYGKRFISHFLPKNPIYVNLLPQNVQEVIGKTHKDTQAAQALLLHEGFQFTDEVDIFDAGPKLRALKQDIFTIKTSNEACVVDITPPCQEKELMLISNEKITFRACLATVEHKGDKKVALSPDAAKVLQVGLGDTIRYSPLHTKGLT